MNPIKRDGVEFVCKVPDELGRVKRLIVRDGKVTAETESGIEMIVPMRAIVDEETWFKDGPC
jgi:hypothetical protein